MGPMTGRPVLRTLLVVVLAALASAATWWAWLGWESGYVTDPATGAVTGPYSVAQVAACVLTLVVVALVAGWFAAPWWVAPAITVAFVWAWTADAAGQGRQRPVRRRGRSAAGGADHRLGVVCTLSWLVARYRRNRRPVPAS